MKEQIDRFKNYINEVKLETKNITWPTQKELINLTIVVIGLTIALSVYVGVIDKVFVEAMVRFIK